MYVVTKYDVENNEYIAKVYVSEAGTNTATEDEEVELFKDYNEKLRYKDLDFSGHFILAEGVPMLTDGESGDLIKLVLKNQEVPVNEKFCVEYRTDARKVLDSELGENLTTKYQVAAAKATCFAETIKKALEAIMEDLRTRSPNFTREDEEMI